MCIRDRPRSRRAATATVDYTITGISSTTTTIEFQPGIISNGRVSSTNYLFSIPEKVTGTVENGTAEGVVDFKVSI